MKSKRPDGRGHWPAGRRRNPDAVRWSRVRLRLSRLLDTHPQRGVVSARALADAIGVSDRTVRRWIAGEDRPDPQSQQAVEQWVDERQAALRRRR